MKPWWHKTTVYQIYPRSFYDANGDGIGDLRGLVEKLDYIRDLGFETIWISPFFPSPLADHGYDIMDYYGVAPEYGSQADFEELLKQAHARGLKILLDLVLNHTSGQHPWFLESRSSRHNPKADWYIWHDGRGRRPPNNWFAMPGGGAWHYAPERGQWYMASFLPFQPDLNWRNPAVKNAMFDMVRHWLRLGVDGFRLDIFNALMKDETFRDNPFKPGFYDGGVPHLHDPCMQHCHPDTFALAKELRSVVREFNNPERILLGEVMGTREQLRQLLGGDQNDGLNLVFMFDMILMLPWQRRARWLGRLLRDFEKHFPEPLQPTCVFGNHDMRRLMSKIGNDPDLARLLAMFQMTARGVPTVYMGEEIGMTDLFIPKAQAQDPVSHLWKRVPDCIRRVLPVNLNRDMNRTPMQWNSGPNAGFCPADAVPWLPVNEKMLATCNVERQCADPGSLLSLYRDLLRVRRDSPALHSGTLKMIEALPSGILGYARQHEDQCVDVLLNFRKRSVTLPVQDGANILLSTSSGAVLRNGQVRIPARSGVLVRH